METQAAQEKFEGYAVVELFGHIRLAGYCRESTFVGAPMLRLDVPRQDASCWVNSDPPSAAETETTQNIAPGALFRFTPVKASVARAIAKHARPLELHWLEECELGRDAPTLPEGRPGESDAEVEAEGQERLF